MSAAVLPVFASDLEFLTLKLPWAILERGYAPPPLQVRQADKCPSGGLGFSVVSGALPPGIQLSSLGYLAGTPTRAGTFAFTIRVIDGCTWTARLFQLVVAQAPVIEAKPAGVTWIWKSGDPLPASTIHLTSTWPHQSYQTQLGDDWLEISHSEDALHLRLRSGTLSPGRYTSWVELRADQAQPVRIPVSLIVE